MCIFSVHLELRVIVEMRLAVVANFHAGFMLGQMIYEVFAEFDVEFGCTEVTSVKDLESTHY